jgi:mono/diheme cytochrome c family protein
LSDDELGAIIAYIKSVPPVNNEFPSPSVGVLGRVFVTLFRDEAKEWLPAEKIDHSGPRPIAPEPAISEEYGKYLITTRTCLVCHKTNDISAAPGGNLAGWAESQFRFAMRQSGDRSMSISVRRMSNDELAAMWLYLQTLSPN